MVFSMIDDVRFARRIDLPQTSVEPIATYAHMYARDAGDMFCEAATAGVHAA